MVAKSMEAVKLEPWSWQPFIDLMEPPAVRDLWLSRRHRTSHEGFLAGFVKVLDIFASASAVSQIERCKARKEEFDALAYQKLWEDRLKVHGEDLVLIAYTRCERALMRLGPSKISRGMMAYLDLKYWHGTPEVFHMRKMYDEYRAALEAEFKSIKGAECALYAQIDLLKENSLKKS